MSSMEETCTHNCSTCSAGCGQEEEQKTDYFQVMENLVNALDTEEAADIVDRLNAELEKALEE